MVLRFGKHDEKEVAETILTELNGSQKKDRSKHKVMANVEDREARVETE